MRKQRLTLSFLTIALVVTGSAQSIFSTGFESPISIGDLGGQDGWMVTPSTALATVQGTLIHSGAQAVELLDAASFGRAQKNISASLTEPILTSSFAMYFDDTWDDDMETDRFEAQVRIEGDNGAGTFGIEFGLVRAPVGGYANVPGNGSAFYIEVGTETASLGSAYTLVDYNNVANGWHIYEMTYNNLNNMVSLSVDGTFQTQVAVANDIVSVSGIQLQNQRWGTSPTRNAPLYFDDASVAAVPEPTTVAVILAGIAAFGAKRRLK